MRLFGLNISRARQPHSSYGVGSPPASGIVGYDSEENVLRGLYLGGPDVNPELTGYAKFDIYRQMLAGDPVVRSVSWLYKLPIRSAHWVIEPASEEPEDELVAQFFREQFGLEDHSGWLDLTWDGWLQQSLRFLDWGSMFEELVWAEPRAWAPQNEPTLQPRLVRPLARMAPRSPASIAEIEDDPTTGQITRLRQTLGHRWIEGEKVCHYIYEKEPGSWYGASLLRAMYGAWKIKREVLISAAIGLDRFAAGTPIVWYPQGGGSEKERRAAEMGRELRVHENGYLAVEGPKDEDWSIDVLNGGQTWVDPTSFLRVLDTQIVTGGLAQFAQQGSTETGSRAVAGVLADAFYLAVQAVARQIVEERMRQVFRRVVDVNFGTEYAVPKLRVSKIQARNIPVLVAAIRDLSAAGFNFTDRETQDDLRDQLDLRALPEGLAQTIAQLPPNVGLDLNPSVAPTVPREGDSLAA